MLSFEWKSKLAAALLLIASWMTVCWVYFGTVVPLTTIKAGPWLDPAMVARCAEVVFGTYPELMLILAVLLVLRARFPARLSKIPFRERTLIVFGCLTLAFYVVSGTAVISRYLLVLHVPFVGTLLWLLCSGRARRWLPHLAAGVLVVQVVLFVQIHLGAIRSFVAGFQRVYSEAGLLMKRTEPSDTASVMTSDVGMVAFYSGRPIIDLGGLTSYHVHRPQAVDESWLVATYHPRYIVARVDTGTVGAYLQKLREGIDDSLVEITFRFTQRIGRLGVFSTTEKQWDVVVMELRYRNMVQPAAGRDGLVDSCRRRRAGYWGFCSTTCSSRFV